MAREFGVSINTVEFHLRNLFGKLDVHTGHRQSASTSKRSAEPSAAGASRAICKTGRALPWPCSRGVRNLSFADVPERANRGLREDSQFAPAQGRHLREQARLDRRVPLLAVQPSSHPARRKIDGGLRPPVRSLESGPLQTILSRVSTIGARRAKVSAPGRRHERRLALVANSHYAAMEACAIAKAKRRPRRPWPTKERVAVALELASAAGARPDQSAAD